LRVTLHDDIELTDGFIDIADIQQHTGEAGPRFRVISRLTAR
jgi:hypothetical protein